MAFSPRSKTTYGLPLRKESPTELTYDLKSFVRQAPHDERDKPPNTAQQRLWLDITHMDTSQLQQIDDDYNSNMWKNFKFVRPKHSANFATRKSVPSSAGNARIAIKDTQSTERMPCTANRLGGEHFTPPNYKRYPRPESILSTDDYFQGYPSYSSPVPKRVRSITSSSLYSRQGTPWHYGLTCEETAD
ncbi:hypothetical protein OS493_028608 [Desmophyllum pertusum]|uniref:Uncharacterized protein n=1 Tax=Desmophyllum pertusum TaxID=174260 RepID=A0A9X0CPU8_9CNID|nr:hypothetical protein OS493_028608 [Desmophyllum pertusum]